MTTQADARRTARASGVRQSRIGKRPSRSQGRHARSLKDRTIEIKGPKGQLSRELPPNVDVKVDAGKVAVTPTIGGRDGARFQGLARALISGHGRRARPTGYTKTLQLVGTGYRAEVKGADAQPGARLLAPDRLPAPEGDQVRDPGRLEGNARSSSPAPTRR